jgi:hypothetical protein
VNATIATGEVTELSDPWVRKIALRVVKEMELALEKTVANAADPSAYPLPRQADAAERILQSRLARLRPEQRALAVSRVMPRVRAGAAQRTRAYGDLSRIDLRAAVPVAQQVSALPFPGELRAPKAALLKLEEVRAEARRLDPVTAAAVAPVTDKLELRLHSVRCVDETGSGTFGEVGKDEIALGATTVDETGDTEKVPEIQVGGFNDGDVKTFSPPRRIATFGLREGTEFPKAYFATLVLAEKDLSGGLSDFLSQLLEKIRERVVAALAAAIGGAIGASGGPVGALIGAAVGFVVGRVFELLKAAFADDIFAPRTVTVAVTALSQRFAGGKTDSPEATVTFEGHGGRYQLVYDWRLFA